MREAGPPLLFLKLGFVDSKTTAAAPRAACPVLLKLRAKSRRQSKLRRLRDV
jgi:hypothetical protein